MNLLRNLRRIFHFERTIQSENAKLLFAYKSDMLTACATKDSLMGISADKLSDAEVIVSLTSFGNRISQVYLTIESIMQGTVKPNRIVLWLTDEMKDKKLPVLLQNQIKRGLEISYCHDIRSYKKLIPTLKKYPDSIIVTIDDDVIYYYDFLENLLQAHNETPEVVCAYRVHKVRTADGNKFLPYLEWGWESNVEDISKFNFWTGVGGVLYPKHCFGDDEVLNEKVFMNICKYADDIWFYAMALRSGRKIRKVHTHTKNSKDYYENIEVQDVGLFNKNIGHNSNDVQLQSVFEKYSLFALLK